MVEEIRSDETTTGQEPTIPGGRMPYQSPQLIYYGSLELTQAIVGSPLDGAPSNDSGVEM